MAKGCISITNHSDKPLEIVTIQDSSVADLDRKKVHTIDPKDSMVIFTDRVEHLSWTKTK